MFAYTDFIPNVTKNGGVVFALTNRYGGYSQPPYDSLNLAFHTGDETAVVERNIAHSLEAFKKLDLRCVNAQNLAYMTQIHSTHCALLEENFYEGEARQNNGAINVGEADALVLSRTHMPAMVLVADCNPILFFDKTHNVAALIHAGRKGVFGEICSLTLARMSEHYDTQASDMYVFVGAGIRKCCYEVGDDVCVELGYREQYIEIREGRYFLDLESMLKAEFENLGIMDYYFFLRCSSCDREFFSYRRDGVTGRFALMAMLV